MDQQTELEETTQFYLEAMKNFLKIPSDAGVNNFIIQGPSSDQPVGFSTLIGLFTRPGIRMPPEMPIINLAGDELGMVGWHKRILGFEISQRVKDLKMPVDSETEEMFRKICFSANLPYAMLSVGQAQFEEVLMLSCLAGADP